MIDTVNKPSNQEIERQLARLLASELFTAAPQQAQFIEFVVRRALQGAPISEKAIAAQLFPEWPRDSTIVRVTAINVRKRLARYYAESADELLRIDLPASKSSKRPRGQAYVPLFSYNAAHAVDREYRLGKHQLSQMSPMEISKAIGHFQKVLELQPDHVGAHVGIIDAVCVHALYMGASEPGKPHTYLLQLARDVAADALRLHPDNWRVHAAMAATHLCWRELEDAEARFDQALLLNRSECLDYPWYPALLLCLKRDADALALVKAYAEAHVESALAQAGYGVYCYALRRYGDADKALNRALSIDRNSWLAHLALAMLALARDDGELALRYVERLEDVLDERYLWALPGLRLLLTGRAKPRKDKVFAKKIALLHQTLVDDLPFVNNLQAAFESIAIEQYDDAIFFLERAWEDFDPFTLWLDRWPLLDPLRSHPRFRALLRRAANTFPDLG